MKKLISQVLKSKVVSNRINPQYGKLDSLSGGNICVIPSAGAGLGDLIVNNHVIRQLQTSYTVYYGLTESYLAANRSFFQNHCVTSNRLIFPNGKSNWYSFIAEIKRLNIKAVILNQWNILSEYWFYLAGVPIIVMPKGNSILANKEFDLLHCHYSERGQALYNMLSGKVAESSKTPFFPFKKINQPEQEERNGIHLGLHFGGDLYWMRRWPVMKFLEVSRLFLKNYDGKIFLIGGKDESLDNKKFKKLLCKEMPYENRVINCAGMNLNETANVLDSVDLYLGNDSGPMHMATALHTQVISIFGPSSSFYYGPDSYNSKNATISLDLECAPCNSTGCKLTDDDKKYSCLTELPVSTVWQKLESELNKLKIPSRIS